MSKPLIKIVNVETGEEIEREMTDAEFEQYEADIENAKVKDAEAKAKTAERQALLDRLGVTEEQLRLILG